MNEEWNEELFLEDLEFSESTSPTAATTDPRIILAVIIILSTLCCWISGGCS